MDGILQGLLLVVGALRVEGDEQLLGAVKDSPRLVDVRLRACVNELSMMRGMPGLRHDAQTADCDSHAGEHIWTTHHSLVVAVCMSPLLK